MSVETPAPKTPPKAEGVIRSRGILFPKHPDIIRGRIRRLLRTNTYEAKESTAAMAVVKKDDVILELGGGIGYMSSLVASKRGIKSVHSFEANPHLIPYIKEVHALNRITNAEVTHGILGARKGQVDFYVRQPMLGSSMQVLEGEVDPPSVKVDVMNANTVMKAIKPTVLICDIEGAEADLIPLMDLSGLRAAILETHPQWIGPEGMNKVFRAFMDAGLAYFANASDGKVLCFLREW